MPSWGQRERSVLTVENIYTGEKQELPSFTCSHCNRVVVLNANRDLQKKPRNVCRKCDALTCDYCTGLECYDFQRDLEAAYGSLDGQPYLLRGLRADGKDAGEPVRRLFDERGGQTLALARDIGYTDRAMAKLWRPGDGSAF